MLDEYDIILTIEHELKFKIKDSHSSLFLYPNWLNGVEVLYIIYELSRMYSINFEQLIIFLKDVTISIDNICIIIKKLQQ